MLSKFHVARPNRSRVTNKSLKLRTPYFENGRVKTEAGQPDATDLTLDNPPRES